MMLIKTLFILKEHLQVIAQEVYLLQQLQLEINKGAIRVSINGTDRWIRFYDSAV